MSWPIDADAHLVAAWLLVRGVALSALVAHVSLAVQVRGLYGRDGIAPIDQQRAALQGLGGRRWLVAPSLLWWVRGDVGLAAVVGLGGVTSLLAALDVATVPALLVAWACYGSFATLGTPFLSYQWDVLLCEALLVAAVVAAVVPASPVALAVALVLVLRLMVASGVVKLRSGDLTWRGLTALDHHFATQPLPNRLAWWAHRMPRPVRRAATATVLAVEVLVPWLLLVPGWPRGTAVALLVGLQVAIAATGNYAFFNLLSVVLLLLLVPDAAWQALAGDTVWQVLAVGAGEAAQAGGPVARWLVGLVAALLLVAQLARLAQQLTGSQRLAGWLGALAGWRLAAPYGLFAVMTTSRPELRVEGSDDGRSWQTFELPAKPGDPRRVPRQVAPHQPRLDWQLWFAALGPPEASPWLMTLCQRLLEGAPPVQRLFADDPFDGRPPRLVRVLTDDYRFTSWSQRRREGRWWDVTPLGVFLPPLELRDGRLRLVADGEA